MPFLQQLPTVPPVGPMDAKILLVGEAPSDKELEKGKPFVGPAGEVLDSCLNHAGLIRSELRITNLFKFKVSKDKLGNIYDRDKTLLFHKDKGLTDEGKVFAKELHKEVQEVNPNIVVTLGVPAMNAFIEHMKITKWRGSILAATKCSKVEHKVGQKVIPTIHPAAVIRGSPLDKYKIAADLKKAARHSDSPDLDIPEQKFVPTPGYGESLFWLAHFRKLAKEGHRINYDIEISRGQVDCLSFAIDGQFAVSISLEWPSEDQERAVLLELANLMELPNINLCNENILFDIVALGFKCGIISPVTSQRLDDPMTAMGIIYPDFPKSLAFLTSIYTDFPYYKDDGKAYSEKDISRMGGIERRRRYNCQDSCTSIESMNALDRELDALGYREQYEDTMKLYPPLATMMIRGTKINSEKLEETKKEITEEIDRLQSELNTLAGRELNVNSTPQCIAYFYDERGIRPFTKDGRPTADEKAMARLAKGTATRPPIPEAKLVIQIRRLSKLLSTYFGIVFDHDNRFRCSYNPRGTTTGRLSSSQTVFGTGMNYQNIPHMFRQFIVADPGYILVEIDKRQAEWIVVAYLAGDARMIEVHEKKLDAHARTGELITGVPMDLIKKEDKLLKHETDPESIASKREELLPEIFEAATFLPRTMTIRQAGKKSNHGLNYGMGPNKFALENEVPDDDAKKMCLGYHQGYPGVANTFYEYCKYRLSKDRTLENLFGHKRRFLLPWGDKLLKAAYDYIPQSTVGWIINYGLIGIYHERHELLRDVELLANIHDSVLLQFPLSLGWDGISKAIEICCTHLDPVLEFRGRQFQIGTDIKLGYNWRDMNEVSREENSPSKIEDAIKDLEQ